MERLFGIPINIVMTALVVMFTMGTVALLISVLMNKIMFKIAPRNLPRRPVQTCLILLGLMLAAAIFSASFSTGDTLRRSIQSLGTKDLGQVDIEIVSEGVEVGVQEVGRYGKQQASTL